MHGLFSLRPHACRMSSCLLASLDAFGSLERTRGIWCSLGYLMYIQYSDVNNSSFALAFFR